MLALLMKAVRRRARRRSRDFNASLDGDDLVLKHYCHIGFAADTPNGLVVPVIQRRRPEGHARDRRRADASCRARRATGKLGPDDMQGGTFTISSLGGIGGTALHADRQRAARSRSSASSRSAMKPVWDGTEFVPRLMLPLSLSYDHRVIDGAAAARFSAHLAQRARRTCGGCCCDATRRVVVPDIGDFTDVPVIEVLVAAGDKVAVEEPLVIARVRQGDDGGPAPGGGHGRGAAGRRSATRCREGTPLRCEALDGEPTAADARAGRRRPPRRASPPTRRAPRRRRRRRRPRRSVLVLGSGPGGYTAAFRAADLGLDASWSSATSASAASA